MIARGPESDDDRALRIWFSEQRAKNLDRLEEGAKAIAQLVTGLYGVLFAILAFSSDPAPAYLRDGTVRFLGVGAVGAFFLALLATLAVIFPRANAYKQDELTSMRRARKQMEQIKSWGLILGLVFFLIGMAYLAALIGRILWML
jgi:hypothetical protein